MVVVVKYQISRNIKGSRQFPYLFRIERHFLTLFNFSFPCCAKLLLRLEIDYLLSSRTRLTLADKVLMLAAEYVLNSSEGISSSEPY